MRRIVIVSVIALAVALGALLAFRHRPIPISNDIPTQTPSSTSSSNIIRIVSSLPRTGSAATQTISMTNGIRMALQEAGGKVEVAGVTYTLDYVDWDDASPTSGTWDPAVEKANAQKAIGDPQVMAYIGTYNSGAAKVSMPDLNAAGLTMISPANTWPGLTKPGVGEADEPMKYRPSGKVTYFRVVPADDLQGAVGAKWAQELAGKGAKVFVLHDRELYGKGIAEMFRKNAEPNGLNIVGFEGIDGKAGNYRALVSKIRESEAQLVYFGGTTETGAGKLMKDIDDNGLPVKVIMPDAGYNEALISSAGAGPLENKVFITFGGVPPEQATGKGKAFVDAYVATYKVRPEGYAAYAYECTKVVLDALIRSKRMERAAVVEAIAATKDFDGALGTWSFDANGDTSLTTMSGNTVKDGKFTFVKILGQ